MSIRFKLSPELADGSNYTIVDNVEDLLSAIKEWAEYIIKESPGESFEVETIEMSDTEASTLPEI
jgi:hypothetical protein